MPRSILTDDFIQTVCQNGIAIDVSRKKNVSPIAIKTYNIVIFVDAASNGDSSHMIPNHNLNRQQTQKPNKIRVLILFPRFPISRRKLFYCIRLDLNTFAKRARSLSLKPMECQCLQFKGISYVDFCFKCALKRRIVLV